MGQDENLSHFVLKVVFFLPLRRVAHGNRNYLVW